MLPVAPVAEAALYPTQRVVRVPVVLLTSRRLLLLAITVKPEGIVVGMLEFGEVTSLPKAEISKAGIAVTLEIEVRTVVPDGFDPVVESPTPGEVGSTSRRTKATQLPRV